MSKERISASVDPEVAAYLQQETVNCSGTINQLVKRQMVNDDTSEELLKLRISQVESEREALETRLESKIAEEQRLKDQLENRESERERILEEAIDKFHLGMLEEDNPAVELWSEKAGMSETEFIDEMSDRLD